MAPPFQQGVTGAQLRAARALLDLSAQQLADLCKLSRGTIDRMEHARGPVNPVNMERVLKVLEDHVIFLPANGEGAGVRLRKRKRKGS